MACSTCVHACGEIALANGSGAAPLPKLTERRNSKLTAKRAISFFWRRGRFGDNAEIGFDGRAILFGRRIIAALQEILLQAGGKFVPGIRSRPRRGRFEGGG